MALDKPAAGGVPRHIFYEVLKCALKVMNFGTEKIVNETNP